jgi:hypothetical protein
VQLESALPASLPSLSLTYTQVFAAFNRNNDRLAPTYLHLTALLERNIKVIRWLLLSAEVDTRQILIYNGKQDWICNFIGAYRMVSLPLSVLHSDVAPDASPRMVGRRRLPGEEARELDHACLQYKHGPDEGARRADLGVDRAGGTHGAQVSLPCEG